VDSQKTEDGRQTAEDVDRAIDLAVREMLDVEPRADLPARVIEHIARPRRAFNWTWVAMPAAVAVVVVLAVVLWQPRQPLVSHAVTQIDVRPSDRRLPPRIARREQPPRLPVRTARPRDGRITAAVAMADDTNFSNAPPTGFAVVVALAAPPPIKIDQIAPADPPTVSRLAVAPLHLPALELNALSDSPPERREE
jgi:hypothetical protein